MLFLFPYLVHGPVPHVLLVTPRATLPFRLPAPADKLKVNEWMGVALVLEEKGRQTLVANREEAMGVHTARIAATFGCWGGEQEGSKEEKTRQALSFIQRNETVAFRSSSHKAVVLR